MSIEVKPKTSSTMSKTKETTKKAVATKGATAEAAAPAKKAAATPAKAATATAETPAKSNKKAAAPVQGKSGRPQGSVYKPKNEVVLEGLEMLQMTRNGYTMGETAEHFGVEYQVAAQRVALAQAPVAVHRAIDEGRIAPTTCLKFIRKSKTAAQIVEDMEAYLFDMEAGHEILGEDGVKLTIKRKLGSVQEQFSALLQSKEVKGARAKNVAALLELIINSPNPQAILQAARELA
jgi:hypothetical protein